MAHVRIHRLGNQPERDRKQGGGRRKRKEGLPLGRLLKDAGLIAEEQLEAALSVQRKSFLPLGRILRDECGVDDAALGAALKQQTHTPRVFLRFFPVSAEALALLPAEYCQDLEVVPFERIDGLLCVACANPTRKDLAVELSERTGLEVRLYRAPWDDIRRKLESAPKGA
ncbi:MAG: hypothetical protein M5U26_05850 [Planctomycetota bacterium]|nr:hypothetical protein [Planctomycetota bacterium]